MVDSLSYNATTIKDGIVRVKDQELILEEPLSLRIEGNPYAVVMRTPGDEINHAAGFFLSEGLVSHPDEFTTIGYCTEEGVNVVTATLTPRRRKKVENLLDRRGFVSQTSCGICGKELIKDIHQIVRPVSHEMQISSVSVGDCVQKLTDQQLLYHSTHGAHAALILDSQLLPLAFAEDVGRHNALDKAIGQAFMQNRLEQSNLAVLSSRISYELVQKAARAGLEMIVALSRPTSLAVELASQLKMTLIVHRPNGLITVFCGKDRII